MCRCREESEASSVSLVVMAIESANLTVQVPMWQFFIVSVSFCIKGISQKMASYLINYCQPCFNLEIIKGTSNYLYPGD